MLIWAGLFLILLGTGCVLIDRPAAHFFYDHIPGPTHRFLDSITHWAKAGHWLAAATLALILAWTALHVWRGNSDLILAEHCALAFIFSLALGSAILHLIKLVLGRRRPRDDMEMKLYGFVPFAFDTSYNSFPSGHALTITCVAAILACVWPMLWPLWLAIALVLGLTRALLTAHFLSDVFIGAGIGLIATREIVLHFFLLLAPHWF